MNHSFFILFLWLLFGLTSCVERRIDIASTPSEAEVYLDGIYQGKTPISIPFDFYGTREVRLRKRAADPTVKDTSVIKSYETFSTTITLVPPLYETFPIDFFTENIIPYQWQDIHTFNFALKESSRLTREDINELLKRNDALKAHMELREQEDSDVSTK